MITVIIELNGLCWRMTMNKFKVGDFVIIKSTIGDTNEVRKVIDVKFTPIGDLDFETYIVSGGSIFGVHQLELWNPKTDLEGGYKMKEIGMNKKYRTRDSRDVRLLIIAEDVLDKHRVIGVVDSKIQSWTIHGQYSGKYETEYDLIEVNPYADFEIDDKVIVWNDGVGIKCRGYFAGVGVSHERPLIWDDGQTSWSTKSDYCYTTSYDNCVKWDGTDD